MKITSCSVSGVTVLGIWDGWWEDSLSLKYYRYVRLFLLKDFNKAK